ncbi:MAG: 4Fe-4S binding protein [Synergistetes bacterium]|nr:MAG: 4Fe-4S ferredoxin iron-sulfur binding domain protein [bacterium 42_11]MBC7331988.1 4Fe-4S binding protein [Synergistota bacterium]MDK2870827.1 2-oxoglutarate ferredoxin oxidoreductase subunit delta [bacterium]
MAGQYKVVINEKWCKGCGLCVAFCPKNVLVMGERLKAEVKYQENCIGCRRCENYCPDFAIIVEEAERVG